MVHSSPMAELGAREYSIWSFRRQHTHTLRVFSVDTKFGPLFLLVPSLYDPL